MSSHPSQYEHQTTYIKYYFCMIRKFSYFTDCLRHRVIGLTISMLTVRIINYRAKYNILVEKRKTLK